LESNCGSVFYSSRFEQISTAIARIRSGNGQPYCKLGFIWLGLILIEKVICFGCLNAGSPDKQGIVQKETQTVQWDRKFIVHIDFAAKVNMRAFCDAVTEQPGGQVDRAQDALRVLDMVLRESASSKYGEFFFDVLRLNFS